MTYVCSENLNPKYGCEYIRSSVNVNMGPLDKGNKFIFHRKVKPHYISNKDNDVISKEKNLIKFYGKWKPTNCAQDILSRKRTGTDVSKYGITAKIDKRMSIINENVSHLVICIVTLIHKDNVDKYNDFVLKNRVNIKNIIDNRFLDDIVNWE